MLSKLLIYFLLLQLLPAAEVADAEHGPSPKDDTKARPTNLPLGEWKQTNVVIQNPNTKKSYKAEAQQMAYTTKKFGGPFSFIVFNAGTNAGFAGVQQDFYVQIDTNIFGGRLRQSGIIYWGDSLIPTGSQSKSELATALRNCLSTSDEWELFKKAVGLLDPDVHENFTDLRWVFGGPAIGAFESGVLSSKPSENTKITSVELAGDELKLRIENPDSDFIGDVWIEPRTRKVVRSEVVKESEKAIESAK